MRRRESYCACSTDAARRAPIYAFSPSEVARRRLSLHSGVIPEAIRSAQNTDQVVEEMEDLLFSEGAVAAGDTLVVAAGAPLFVRGTTNLRHLRRVKEQG